MPRPLLAPSALVAAIVLSGCPLAGPEQVAVLVPEATPPPAPVAPTVTAPDAPPAPAAVPSREARPRCVRLADDSGWTCSPAASSPEELAGLVAEAESSRPLPDYRLAVVVADVARATGAVSPAVAFLQLSEEDEFGGIYSFVALEGPAGWGFAADAGAVMFGVNGDGTARLVGARRDLETGLVLVETAWHGSDAACTEPLSWTFDEQRSTVCDPTRLVCRTLPTERTAIESRWHPRTDTSTSRRLPESFRAALDLRPAARVALRSHRGRLPRALRGSGRPTTLAALPVNVEPFRP